MLTGHALHLLFDVDKVKCHCLDDSLLSYIVAVKKQIESFCNCVCALSILLLVVRVIASSALAMEVEGENNKQMRPEDRDDTWFQTVSYKFRRTQWHSPFPTDREDPTYGQSLQSPYLPDPVPAVPVTEEPAPAEPIPEELGAAMEVEENE